MRRNTTYIRWVYLFISGFLAGILLMNLNKTSLLGEAGVFDAATLERMQFMDIDSKGLLLYILQRRIKEQAVFFLLSTTVIGLFAVYACIFWRGILTGMVMSAAVIRFGMKGMLLILGIAFPHQMLLFPAWFMMLDWCYENCCRIYFPEKGNTFLYKSKRRQIIKQTVSLAWILAVVGIGCILESYVNPMLLSDFLKIF